MQQVLICEDVLGGEWLEFDTPDIRDLLVERYKTCPPGLRIYHKQVSEVTEVTPRTPEDIERLPELEGPLFVVVGPRDPFTIIVLIIVVIIAVVAAFMLAPKIPNATSPEIAENRNRRSANNQLSERTNSARPGGRIPDIYGTVRATPDLIAPTYRVFVNNQEKEFSYLCLGRGHYDISDIRDDTTTIASIAGSSVEIYGPETSPNSGDDPQVRVGAEITEALRSTKRIAAVNGQTLRAPNSSTLIGQSDVIFESPDTIRLSPSSEKDFTSHFEVSDNLVVSGSTTYTYNDVSEGSGTLDMAGTYTIVAVSQDEITLSNPSAVNSDWGTLALLTPSETTGMSPTLSVTGTKWVGPFILDDSDMTQVLTNFVGTNGLFKDDGTNQIATSVAVQLEVTPVDASDVATGPAETFDITLRGSATSRDRVGATLYATPTTGGRSSVRARRLTSTDTAFNGTVVDEVQWRDVIISKPVNETHFGSVTTCYLTTFATAGALAVRDRKLNMLASRKIPTRVSGDTFTTELTATSRADEIIAAIALDPKIGNRPVDQLDVDSIYNAISEVESYFGTSDAIEFNGTFDGEKLSFEETLYVVAQNAFCSAYRRGNKIRLAHELATVDSTLLFNHRNKVPKSEKRSVTFGTRDDVDGLEFEYVSPDDDSQKTVILPVDGSAINPKSIESQGIRNDFQAQQHAWRAWNKIRYNNVSVEFKATNEAELMVVGDRFLCADNTRATYTDGQVKSQSGLTLTLSRDVPALQSGSQIFLQHYDGTVESIPIVAGTVAKTVVLEHAPKQPLSLADENFAQALYNIVLDPSERDRTPFLLTEKRPQRGITTQVKGIGYDAAFYLNDAVDFWLIDDSTNDASPDAHSTTVTGVSSVTDDIAGDVLSAAATSSVTSDCGRNASYSFSAWVRLGSSSEDRILFDDGTDTLVVNDDMSITFTRGATSLTTTQLIAADVWTQIVLTVDATTATIYVDKTSVSTSVPAGSPGDVSFIQDLDGKAREIRLYRRAISDEEVYRLRMKTRPGVFYA